MSASLEIVLIDGSPDGGDGALVSPVTGPGAPVGPRADSPGQWAPKTPAQPGQPEAVALTPDTRVIDLLTAIRDSLRESVQDEHGNQSAGTGTAQEETSSTTPASAIPGKAEDEAAPPDRLIELVERIADTLDASVAPERDTAATIVPTTGRPSAEAGSQPSGTGTAAASHESPTREDVHGLTTTIADLAKAVARIGGERQPESGPVRPTSGEPELPQPGASSARPHTPTDATWPTPSVPAGPDSSPTTVPAGVPANASTGPPARSIKDLLADVARSHQTAKDAMPAEQQPGGSRTAVPSVPASPSPKPPSAPQAEPTTFVGRIADQLSRLFNRGDRLVSGGSRRAAAGLDRGLRAVGRRAGRVAARGGKRMVAAGRRVRGSRSYRAATAGTERIATTVRAVASSIRDTALQSGREVLQAVGRTRPGRVGSRAASRPARAVRGRLQAATRAIGGRAARLQERLSSDFMRRSMASVTRAAANRFAGTTAGRLGGGAIGRAAVGTAARVAPMLAGTAAGGAAAGGAAAAVAAVATAAGPVGLAAGAAVGALVTFSGAVGIAARTAAKLGNELEDYSSAVARQRDTASVSRELSAMERAQRTGGEVAQIEASRARRDDAWYRAMTEVHGAILNLAPVVEAGNDTLRAGTEAAIANKKYLELIATVALNPKRLLTGEIKEDFQDTLSAAQRSNKSIWDIFTPNDADGPDPDLTSLLRDEVASSKLIANDPPNMRH